MKFPCTGCGACCRKVKENLNTLKVFGFPYTYREDGACEMLDGDKCSVYETRPMVCNIEQMSKFYKSKKSFYRDNIKACNQLQEEFGIDLKYRIT